jgi:GNAT superfamily N-acetyltransferase
MAQGRYRIEPLATHHNRGNFSSGVDTLDRYFRQQAGQDLRRYAASVWVACDVQEELIVGFSTLSATSIGAAHLPLEELRRLPRYPDLPAMLIGRLAVDRRYRGQGFGELLLNNAMQRAHALQSEIGAAMVLVDAKDDTAVRFYERYGFARVLDDPRRLFIPMTTIARMVQP